MTSTWYNIEYKEGNWRHELSTLDFDLFQTEATKLLDEKVSPMVAPAFMTAVPFMKDAEVDFMQVGDIILRSWVSKL